jgi:hypothetical protein
MDRTEYFFNLEQVLDKIRMGDVPLDSLKALSSRHNSIEACMLDAKRDNRVC